MKEWFESPVVNTKSGPKMNATPDGNKCCDIAYGCRNNATANALCNQSKRWSFAKGECATFWTGSVFVHVALFIRIERHQGHFKGEALLEITS